MVVWIPQALIMKLSTFKAATKEKFKQILFDAVRLSEEMHKELSKPLKEGYVQ